MEYEDYLKRQIDQVGRVLGKIFSDLMGLKNKGQLNEGIETCYQVLKSELDLDIQKLLEIPESDFMNTLKSKHELSMENLEKLAELFFLLADQHQKAYNLLYSRCLTIYEHIEKEGGIYSLDRHKKIQQLKNILS